MRKILNCRRSTLALISILILGGLGFHLSSAEYIAVAISGIVIGVAGSNAYEKKDKPGDS